MISIFGAAVVALALLLVQQIWLVIYHLYFHPLANIPGPRLAAATQWYEFYYDIIKWPGGQYSWEVDKMHEKYGPIVRVTPYEVHIKDPEWFDRLYCNPKDGIRDKYLPQANITGTPLGTFGTVTHDLHRRRRAAVSSFFSKQAINNTEPKIHQKTSLLCSNIRKQQNKYGKVELRVNFTALATEIVAAHVFHDLELECNMKLLDKEQNAKNWQKTILALANLTPAVKQAPWLISFALKLPVGLLMMVYAPLGRVIKMNVDMIKSAESAIASEASSPSSASHNIFHKILHSSLPPSEKLAKRIAQEGVVSIGAGGETCGRMLTCAIYHILANQDRVMPPLMSELQTVMPEIDTIPVLNDLEKLPYLTAVIKETLRITSLMVSRLPLVAPAETLSYGGYVIPHGHAVSMSQRHILQNEKIYRRPDEFLPARWLKNDPDIEVAERYYVPFSRGTRNCIGINLAHAELYIVLATILRRFELKLHDVVYERDIEASRDCFISETRIDSPGVHVTLKDREK